jgi:peptidoglycan hydrolase CwlO-like protein
MFNSFKARFKDFFIFNAKQKLINIEIKLFQLNEQIELMDKKVDSLIEKIQEIKSILL